MGRSHRWRARLANQECDGGYAAADRANAALSDALLAFRFRVAKTGRGCEMTVNIARGGEYFHFPLE